MGIVQISEKEFCVGGNKASLIEGNVIHIIVQGEQTAESSILQTEVNNKLASLVNGKINYLVDLNIKVVETHPKPGRPGSEPVRMKMSLRLPFSV